MIHIAIDAEVTRVMTFRAHELSITGRDMIMGDLMAPLPSDQEASLRGFVRAVIAGAKTGLMGLNTSGLPHVAADWTSGSSHQCNKKRSTRSTSPPESPPLLV